MKNGKKLKLGDAHVTPRHIQEVQASKLGDAQGTPFFINKVSGHLSMRYIFIASYDMFYSCSVLFFVISFPLFCLLQLKVGPQHIFFGERHAPFSLPRTLQFHSYYSASVHFLLELPLVFVLFRTFQFSLQLGLFNFLVFDEFCSCELFQIS